MILKTRRNRKGLVELRFCRAIKSLSRQKTAAQRSAGRTSRISYRPDVLLVSNNNGKFVRGRREEDDRKTRARHEMEAETGNAMTLDGCR